MAIMTIILAALVMTLRVGDIASGIGTAKVDIQSDVKTIVDWITRDVRQTKIEKLCLNSPTTDHMKFPLWDWNNTSLEQTMTDQYVEYEYDSGTQTLTRRFIEGGAVSYEQNFTDITMSPFYTSYTDETSNNFDNSSSGTLCSNATRTLIIAIKKEKAVRNTPLNFTMIEQVRIRNE